MLSLHYSSDEVTSQLQNKYLLFHVIRSKSKVGQSKILSLHRLKITLTKEPHTSAVSEEWIFKYYFALEALI